MPRPVQPRRETDSGLLGRSLLEPQLCSRSSAVGLGYMHVLVWTDSGLLVSEDGGFSRRPKCIRGEGDPGQDQKIVLDRNGLRHRLHIFRSRK